MNDQDKLLKLLKYVHRRKGTPDLHSFVARCAGGESVSVEVTADGKFSVKPCDLDRICCFHFRPFPFLFCCISSV